MDGLARPTGKHCLKNSQTDSVISMKSQESHMHSSQDSTRTAHADICAYLHGGDPLGATAFVHLRLSDAMASSLLRTFPKTLTRRSALDLISELRDAAAAAHLLDAGRLVPCSVGEIGRPAADAVRSGDESRLLRREIEALFTERVTKFGRSQIIEIRGASRTVCVRVCGGSPEAPRFDLFCIPVDDSLRLSTSEVLRLLQEDFRARVLTQAEWLERMKSFARRMPGVFELKRPELVESLIRIGSAARFRGAFAIAAFASQWTPQADPTNAARLRRVCAKLPQLHFCDYAVECRLLAAPPSLADFEIGSDGHALSRYAAMIADRYRLAARAVPSRRSDGALPAGTRRAEAARRCLDAAYESLLARSVLQRRHGTDIGYVWKTLQKIVEKAFYARLVVLRRQAGRLAKLSPASQRAVIQEIALHLRTAPSIWRDTANPTHPYALFFSSLDSVKLQLVLFARARLETDDNAELLRAFNDCMAQVGDESASGNAASSRKGRSKPPTHAQTLLMAAFSRHHVRDARRLLKNDAESLIGSLTHAPDFCRGSVDQFLASLKDDRSSESSRFFVPADVVVGRRLRSDRQTD